MTEPKMGGHIKIDLEETECEVFSGFIWLKRVQQKARVNTVMNLRVP
jgi:hypothetical protein